MSIHNELKDMVAYSKTLNVLYVEDNKDTRDSSLLILQNLFTNITMCINGQEGLDTFNKKHYDLIFTDISMPIMDGITMIKKIRKMNKKVSIIVVSAHNEEYFQQESAKYNLDSYIVKPTDFTHWMETITKVVKIIKQKSNE